MQIRSFFYVFSCSLCCLWHFDVLVCIWKWWGVLSSKIKLRMMLFAPNLTLYSPSSLQAYFDQHCLFSPGQSQWWVLIHCPLFLLEEQGLAERSKYLCKLLCCLVVNHNLGYLQHIQGPGLAKSITVVGLLASKSSTCVISSMCNVLSNWLIFLKK